LPRDGQRRPARDFDAGAFARFARFLAASPPIIDPAIPPTAVALPEPLADRNRGLHVLAGPTKPATDSVSFPSLPNIATPPFQRFAHACAESYQPQRAPIWAARARFQHHV